MLCTSILIYFSRIIASILEIMLSLLLIIVATAVASTPSYAELSATTLKESATIMPWLAPLRSSVERSLRICFVEDPSFDNLALKLQARGHIVTMARFRDSLAYIPSGIKSLRLSDPVATSGKFGRHFDRSVATFETLRSSEFDLIVFSSEFGLGYMSLEGKRSGLDFAQTSLVVQAHADGGHVFGMLDLDEMVARFISRKSIELADAAFVTTEESLSERLFGESVTVWSVADSTKLMSLLEAQRQVTPHGNVITRPSVTVVVVSYNRPFLLKEAVASLKAQTYSNMDIIVVDDASTVATMPLVLEELEADDVTVVRMETNSYLGAARNAGARKANGRYLMFLDDDNVALPNMVETLVNAAERSHSVVAVNAHYLWKASAGTPIPADLSILPKWFPVGPAVLAGMRGNVFGNANFLITREAFYTVSGFSEDRTGLEDYEFHVKSALAGSEYVVVPEALMLYREHDLSSQMYQTMDRTTARARVNRAYSELADEVSLRQMQSRVATSCVFGVANFLNPPADGSSPSCVTGQFTLVIVDDSTTSTYTPQTVRPDIFVSAPNNGVTAFVKITDQTECNGRTPIGGRRTYDCRLLDTANGVLSSAGVTDTGSIALTFRASVNVTMGPGFPEVACGTIVADQTCQGPAGVCFHEDTVIEYNGEKHTQASLDKGHSECRIPHVVVAHGVAIHTTCSGKPLRLTKTHLVFTAHGLVKAEQVQKGDVLYKDLDQVDECTVVSVAQESEQQKYFGLNCLSSVVLADGVKTSTFGDLHTLPSLWMSWVGRVAGIERASKWGDAIASFAKSHGVY